MAVVDELILGLGVKVDGSAVTKIAGFASVLATGVNQALEIANKIYRVFDDIAREMEKVGVASLAMEQLSQRTGMSTDEIQAWTYAAVKMGGTAEEAASDLNNLAAAAVQRGKSLPAFLEEISGFMKGMPLVEAEVFGKGLGLSDSSIRLLQRGQVDFKKLLDDVKKSGAWISPETVENAAEMERHLMVIRMTWDAIKANALGKAIGVVDQMLERLLKWIQNNKTLQDSLAHFAEGLEDVAKLVYVFIQALALLAGGGDDLDTVLNLVLEVLAGMATVLYIIMVPFALLLGLVNALSYGFVYLWQAAENAAAKIKNAFGGVFEWLDKHPIVKALLYATNPAIAAVDYLGGDSNNGDNYDGSEHPAMTGNKGKSHDFIEEFKRSHGGKMPEAKDIPGGYSAMLQQQMAALRTQNVGGGNRATSITDNRRTEITVSGVSDPHQAAAMVVHKLSPLDATAPGNYTSAGGQ